MTFDEFMRYDALLEDLLNAQIRLRWLSHAQAGKPEGKAIVYAGSLLDRVISEIRSISPTTSQNTAADTDNIVIVNHQELP